MAPRTRVRTSCSASGVPMTIALSPAQSSLVAARNEESVAPPDRDDQRAVRQVQIGDAPAVKRRLRVEAVLEQPDGAVGEPLGVDGARRRG